MNARDIQQYARETTDAEGDPVVQIPLHIWHRFTAQKSPSQVEQMNALFQDWQQHPEDTMPDMWWDEFTRFLVENKFTM